MRAQGSKGFILVTAFGGAVLLVLMQLARHASPAVVFAGARIYTSPTAPPIEKGFVVVRDGRVLEVGSRLGSGPPANAEVIDCAGLTLTAGFWNSHVHFIDAGWERSASASADVLSQRLHQMFLRHGFTTVLDSGSPWASTNALRQRIASGEVIGPLIRTSGEALFPRGGAPERSLTETSFQTAVNLEEHGPVRSEEDVAAAAVNERLERGADAVKVYVASWWNDPPVRMTLSTLRTIVQETHRHGKLVLAHPSDIAGIETAIAGGVDVLMHTTPVSGPWPDPLAVRLARQRVSLVPTLKLWRTELMRRGVPEAHRTKLQRTAVDQLRAFVRAGGEVLFGTDAGYMQDADPREEFELMGDAGMDFRQILASLTTRPAARLGDAGHTGRIAVGEVADFVLLDGDPARNPAAFAQVARVVRGGQIVARNITAF